MTAPRKARGLGRLKEFSTCCHPLDGTSHQFPHDHRQLGRPRSRHRPGSDAAIPRSTPGRLWVGASAVGIGEKLGEPGAERRGEAIERRGIDEADVNHVEEMDSILEAEGR